MVRYLWALFMKKVPRRVRMVMFSPVFALWLLIVSVEVKEVGAE